MGWERKEKGREGKQRGRREGRERKGGGGLAKPTAGSAHTNRDAIADIFRSGTDPVSLILFFLLWWQPSSKNPTPKALLFQIGSG